MRLLDTNILVAYFNRSDASHEQVKNRNISDGVINELIFAETANVLERRRLSQEHVLTAIRTLHERMPLEPAPLHRIAEGIRLLTKYFGRLSFTDCMLIVQSKERAHILVTLDRNLQEAARAEGIRVEPA